VRYNAKKMYHNLSPTVSMNTHQRLSAWIYDDGYATNTDTYVELRGYTAGYCNGTTGLNQLLECQRNHRTYDPQQGRQRQQFQISAGFGSFALHEGLRGSLGNRKKNSTFLCHDL